MPLRLAILAIITACCSSLTIAHKAPEPGRSTPVGHAPSSGFRVAVPVIDAWPAGTGATSLPRQHRTLAESESEGESTTPRSPPPSAILPPTSSHPALAAARVPFRRPPAEPLPPLAC